MITASFFTITDLAAAIRAGVHGDVVTAEDPSFPAAAFGVDLTGGQRPDLVVIAADADDVAVTARLAARAGRRVTLSAESTTGPAMATGATGAPETPRLPTILVVTRLLARVTVDPRRRTATVGAGSTWRQVLDAAEPFGLAPISGPGPWAGVAAPRSDRDHDRGHRADGRLRPVARTFGFAADHVLQLEVVTPLGKLIRVDAHGDPAAFAAFRRGRPEFGLVTALTIALMPIDRGLASRFTRRTGRLPMRSRAMLTVGATHSRCSAGTAHTR